MLIRLEDGGTIDELKCPIFESENNIASTFLTEHYSSLEKVAESMGVSKGKISDLIHDVFISLVKSERNGEGYNPEYMSGISVEKFVYGRMKAYSKNPIYREDIVESFKIDNGSQNSEAKYISTIAASPDERQESNSQDSFQLAYLNASTADSADDIIDNYSVEEQMNYLLDICNKYDVHMINILKNIDKISHLLNDNRFYKKGMEALEGLKNILEYNNDAKEAIINILQFSQKNKEAFETLLAKY